MIGDGDGAFDMVIVMLTNVVATTTTRNASAAVTAPVVSTGRSIACNCTVCRACSAVETVEHSSLFQHLQLATARHKGMGTPTQKGQQRVACCEQRSLR